MLWALLLGISLQTRIGKIALNVALAFSIPRLSIRHGTATRLFNDKDCSSNPKYSFEAMTRFENRLSVLEEEAPDFLKDFFERDIYSFSINPGEAQQKLSVSSTVYGLQALTEYPSNDLARSVGILSPKDRGDELDGDINSSDDIKITDGPLNEQIRALIHSEWRENDIYGISLLLSIILKLDPSLRVVRTLIQEDKRNGKDPAESTDQKFATMLQKILSGRPRRRRGEDQLFSAYITYVCTTVYVDLANIMNQGNGSLRLGVIDVRSKGSKVENAEDSSDNDSPSTTFVELEDSEFFFKEITIAVSRSAEVARDELCRQLAYRSAGDSGSFDVIKLVYNLLSYVKATESLKGNTLLSTTGVNPINNSNKLNTDDSEDETSIAVQTAVPKINRRLVASALRVFFEEQDVSDGLWDRGQPIYKSFKRGGRNVGNAYVFGIDALGSLLEVLGNSEINRGGNAEVFRPYLRNLEQALDWIERNIDIETTVIAEECNVETGRCYGQALRVSLEPVSVLFETFLRGFSSLTVPF